MTTYHTVVDVVPSVTRADNLLVAIHTTGLSRPVNLRISPKAAREMISILEEWLEGRRVA